MPRTIALPLSGRCQCGALRYEAGAAPLMIYACHCSNCQKQTGSAFVLSATVPEASFRFTRGEPARFAWTSDAGNLRFGWLCGRCGSRIANGQDPSIGILSLRAGTLDDTSWVRPVGHIWLRSAQPWFQPDPDTVRCEQQPTDYAPFVQRFQAALRFSEAG